MVQELLGGSQGKPAVPRHPKRLSVPKVSSTLGAARNAEANAEFKNLDVEKLPPGWRKRGYGVCRLFTCIY